MNPDMLQLSVIILGLLGGFFMLLKERDDQKVWFVEHDFHGWGHKDVMQTVASYEEQHPQAKHYVFSLNREVIMVNDMGVRLSLYVEYDLTEQDRPSDQMDQLMRRIVIEVARRFVATFGTSCISDQKIALETRIRGALQAESSNWGFSVKSLRIIRMAALPKA